MEFPANSNNSTPSDRVREPIPERQRKLKVVTSSAVRRKKPLGARFIGLILSGEDLKTAAIKVAMDTVLPSVKDIFRNASVEMIDRMFGIQITSTRSSSSSSTGHVSYNRMTTSSRDDSRERRNRAMHNFDDILFEDRETAGEVIEYLYDTLDECDQVTVGDFYVIAGLSAEAQDETWGWKDFRTELVAVPVRGGKYRIRLPRPIPLRNTR